MKIKITEIEVNATDLKASQTSELEKALAENREETIDVWVAHAKKNIKKNCRRPWKCGGKEQVMDRREAIEWLKDIKESEVLTDWSYDIALDLAIEALREPTRDDLGDCNRCRFTGSTMCGDCINGSRWARDMEKTVSIKESVEGVAESATTTDCNDCIWNTCNYNKIDWDASEDCISRQQAIEAICRECTQEGYDECRADCIEVVILKNIPPFTPTDKVVDFNNMISAGVSKDKTATRTMQGRRYGMTREEAIKRLSDIRADYSCFDDDERPKYHALSMAIQALQFQDIMVNNPKSAKPTPEVCKNCKDNKQDDWIPVSEKNPSQTGEYLVTVGCDNEATFTDKFGYTPTPDGGWYDPEAPNQTYVDWNKHIIAWRPLPKPYKAESEVEK